MEIARARSAAVGKRGRRVFRARGGSLVDFCAASRYRGTFTVVANTSKEEEEEEFWSSVVVRSVESLCRYLDSCFFFFFSTMDCDNLLINSVDIRGKFWSYFGIFFSSL